ncbi:interleukin-18 receptor 1-like isoform X2 [Sphaeramia orbicularis]|uniref:Interleukin-18 receptor 1-like n=1 Tax=Sphaeramia orbicularis TaxID=375764 RepID=A0A673ASJ6_9TELE|nr:interleukin-18 receptor 1-like isoform X2 [Sphaeramia orbicularis]
MTGNGPLLLLFLLILLPGSHPMKIRQIYVKAGEVVTLHCPHSHKETKPTWTCYTPQETDLSNLSSAEQNQMGFLIHERSLVILSATVKDQGNYSCSLWNTTVQSWFRLIVYTTLSSDLERKTQYPITCYSQEACTLTCPDRNIPDKNILNITTTGIVWKKGSDVTTDSLVGESVSKEVYYFSSVDEEDYGVYTCTRSYVYQGQTYNKTFTVILNVKPGEKWKQPEILSPKEKDVFYVDLGSTLMINCTAVLSSEFDEVLWLSENSFVDRNLSSSVFYTWTQDINDEETKMTASLIFKNVSEKDLSKHYTCKLISVSEPPSFVTITLAQKDHTSTFIVALSIVAMILVVALMALLYVKWKTDIAIFLRNTLGCYSSISDGKSYDAYLMCYKSDSDGALNEDDRKWLENILEEFGYTLCFHDRDVLPEEPVEEAVSECIDQSRTVVLIPTTSDPGPGSGLLTDYGALVEQHSHVVFIRTETNGPKRSQSLKGLDKTGRCVTWKGMSSRLSSSSFCKELRYYLPPPQHKNKETTVRMIRP